MEPRVEVIRCLSDNYCYLLHDGVRGVAVDASEAEPILECVGRSGVTLECVLLTHHHGDHTAGAGTLRKETGCRIVGPRDRRMREVDVALDDMSTMSLGLFEVTPLSVPGHTRSHLAFHFPALNALFTGDTLFCAGCGRLFEGTAGQMWDSLRRLASFADTTLVYCGHEYTEENLRFALTAEPDNNDLRKRLSSTVEALRLGRPTVPSTISLEKATNPFVRASDARAFADLRRRKDAF